MPDISMCSGENCLLKEECYRFTAQPDGLQSYFTIIPYDKINNKCELLINLKGKNHGK